MSDKDAEEKLPSEWANAQALGNTEAALYHDKTDADVRADIADIKDSRKAGSPDCDKDLGM